MTLQVSQEDIDRYFHETPAREGRGDTAQCPPFDFRHLDPIPKAQLTALRFLHEHFIRGLTSSLSVYLRSFVSGNLISIDQLPYADLADSLPSPTCMLYLTMPPYDGRCMVEINQSLLAPLLDLVLGGTGDMTTDPQREITDVETDILESVFRIIVDNLAETWKQIAPVKFALDAVDTKPQLSKRISRAEAVIAIAMEVRLAQVTGTITFAIPCITLKLMRSRFDHQWTSQKSGCEQTERTIKQRLTKELNVTVDCELRGGRIRLSDLLKAEIGDVLNLGMQTPLTISVNGVAKFQGHLLDSNSHVAAVID